jgi:hypothetical protein
MKRLASYLAVAALLVVPATSADHDGSPPVVSGAVTGTLGSNGWYVSDALITWLISEPEGGILEVVGCVNGPVSGEGLHGPFSCSVTSHGGTGAGSTNQIKIDKTPPSISGGPDRSPDTNGWYTSPVQVTFGGTDATSGLAGCSSTTYSGPDTSGVGIEGTCRDNAGHTSSSSVAIAYDGTAPTVTGFRAERPPDSGEWYTSPVSFTFEGSDGGGSGVESCSAARYAGPDKADASVSGTCRDKVGRTSAPRVVPLKYDATPPKLGNLTVRRGNRLVKLSWQASPDATVIEVRRRPGRGDEPETVVFRANAPRFTDTGLENGKRYEYTVAALDAASNADRRTAAVVPLPALYDPAKGARVRGAPLLQWLPVPKATYYNAQLWFKGRKIMSMWPLKPFLQLRRAWAFGGRNHRLRPGVYRWYVWPGFGRKVQRRYGKLIGSSSFVVTR